MSTLVQQIRSTAVLPDRSALHNEIQQSLNHEFPDLASLLSQAAGPSTAASTSSRPSTPHIGSPHVDGARSNRKAKRKRTLQEEIGYWEEEEREATRELDQTSASLPKQLEDTQTKLQQVLSEAQGLSLERYALADKLSGLLSELDAVLEHPGSSTGSEKSRTLLQEMEGLQAELDRLEASLAFTQILEKVVSLSEAVLSPSSHKPSPLAAVTAYRELHELVDKLQAALPGSMNLSGVILESRRQTWDSLKALLSKRLLQASEALKWPLRIQYAVTPASRRREFERAFQDMLYLQTEGDALGISTTQADKWFSGVGLFPLQALVEPISMRFKYHFQGAKNTNRVDKPEWAFSNILDQIYEQSSFLDDYIQPLAAQCGFRDVDVRSEFIMLLFPILLNMLRSRIPKLLDHPALLAHTIYQTVVFDEAIRASDFDLSRTSLFEGRDAPEWEGLAGVLLREEGWFDQWLAGEKKFVDAQLHEIISNSEAWTISDESATEEDNFAGGQKPTVSSRQMKALIEQVTDRYMPLPNLEHKLPFLLTIQLPTLLTYWSRISGSLDAFETLSSAFVRAVPGALSGNARGGIHIDQSRVTGGVAGLGRLVKARLSAGWVLAALKAWADEAFFVEMSADLQSSLTMHWKLQPEALIPTDLKVALPQSKSSSVFDVLIERYSALCSRTEDMIVRHVSVEVENELKQHLQRRWDQTSSDAEPDSSLLGALTSYTTLLKSLSVDIPPIVLARVYRRLAQTLASHIQTRAVYSGWSKFTQQGGEALFGEVADWIQASFSALSDSGSPANSGVEVPWSRLKCAAALLRLPTDSKDAGPTFAQAMAAGWSDGEESLRLFLERIGPEAEGMSKDDLQAILRRRTECWR